MSILTLAHYWGPPLLAQPAGGKPAMRFRDITDNVGILGEWARCIYQDSQGLVWFGTDIGFKSFNGYTYEEYLLEQGDVIVTAITEDHLGNIWAAAGADGIYRLDSKRSQVKRYQVVDTNFVTQHQVYSLSRYGHILIEDNKQNLWASTFQGIVCFIPERDTFELVASVDSNYLGLFYENDSGELWEIMKNGIRLLNDPDEVFVPFVDKSGVPRQVLVNTFDQDSRGDLWLGTWGEGLFHFSFTAGWLTQYSHDPDDPESLNLNTVANVLVDHLDQIWLALDDGGLDLYDQKSNTFFHYEANFQDPEATNPKPILVFEDKDKGLWVSHYHHGITYANSHTNNFTAYHAQIGSSESLSSPYVMAFFERPNGDIWIATDGGGINLWKRSTNTFVHFTHDPFNQNSIGNNKVFQVLEDKQGYLWIDRAGGTDRFDISTHQFKHYEDNGKLQLGHNGEVWLISDLGLYRYDRRADEFKLYFRGISGIFKARENNYWVFGNSIQVHKYELGLEEKPIWEAGESNQICLFNIDLKQTINCINSNAYWLDQDSKGNFWMLLPDQGDTLLGFNLEARAFFDTVVLHSAKDHLRNMLIVDHNDEVWVSTKNGLYHYQPQTKDLDHFDHFDGLASNFLRFGAPISTQRKELIFGSSNGFTIFHPDSIWENTITPPVLITSLKIGLQEVPVAASAGDTLDWSSPMQEHIQFTEQVHLRHFQNSLTFEFAALDYTNPQKNRYQYKLEGYDKNWVSTTATQRRASYTNLFPGTYTFRVRGSNSDGQFSTHEALLMFSISPPWYWSAWSKLLYSLIVLGIVFAIYRTQLKRQLAASEAQRLQDLDTFKTRLYTNLTHEFRTPLTVITGIADLVLENPANWFREGLTMIKRNGQHLLSLVNQLLDLSQLESGRLPVNLIQDDIIQYFKYLTESFHSYAESKDIRLHLLTEVDEWYMDFDPVKIQAIFSNLVGNAIKFTLTGGDVYITMDRGPGTGDGGSLELKIKDNGRGIAEAHLPHIFDRFYQADHSSTRAGEGTGIGLAHTKELVHLLGGSIEVQSKEGKSTEFTVELPVRREAARAPAWEILEETLPISVFGGQAVSEGTIFPLADVDVELPLALLIEDHQDVLQYLAGCLRGQYRLEMATNGRTGIEKAIDLVPDIIISDVMMPGKDGFEVVDRLKRDERTSHIPIILLTAKADMDSRLEGLERGADAYLSKPFEKKELEVRLRKLIELRRQLSARYGALTPAESPTTKSQALEDAFMQKLREIVEDRLEDEEFGIAPLCKELGVSRTQLHRKLKALTNKSTSQVIRTIRMQRAKELLKINELNVSEVGYAVGYANPSHFTQEFTKEFGETPSSFRYDGQKP